MPLPKDTIFRYKELPEKNGRERRQRFAFAPNNQIIEIKTEQKNKSGWVVKGSSRARGHTRSML